ncbi:MAG: IS200/IS605 family transposase [Candidatus Electryonea clarkiae]|nr:IS200/IS605 family transposase [Candidatus Electryonea clarkiae]MDP8287237.1 IS200/IS605 family transposase [Candidatus Electryonea clarkiae]
MADTFTNLIYHVVFSTKNRADLIKKELQSDISSYIGGILREINGVLLETGVMPDHIHILMKLNATKPISDAMRLIKANSSKWINEKRMTNTTFQWQSGYSAFTVSESQIPTVRNYLKRQKEHHRKFSFKEEYLKLLKKHNITFDERYIYD